MRSRLSMTKLLAVFATTTLIFIVGIFAGQYIASMQISDLQEVQRELQLQSNGIDIKYSLLSENPCFALSSENVNEELYFISDMLIDMERAYGKNDFEVLKLVEEYSLLEIRHYMIRQRAKETCESDKNLILYFYSNEGCDECVQQGYVLTFLRQKYLDSMNVYSFNVNINNPAINTFKEINAVQSPTSIPIVVINGETYYGLHDADEIEAKLNK